MSEVVEFAKQHNSGPVVSKNIGSADTDPDKYQGQSRLLKIRWLSFGLLLVLVVGLATEFNKERLISAKSELVNQQLLPRIDTMADLTADLNSLAILNNKLAAAGSGPEHDRLSGEFQHTASHVSAIALSSSKDIDTKIQLATVLQLLTKQHSIVTKSISVSELIAQQHQRLELLRQRGSELVKSAAPAADNQIIEQWQKVYDQSVLLGIATLNTRWVQPIRRSRQKIMTLETSLAKAPKMINASKMSGEITGLNLELKSLLSANEGLILNRLTQLKLAGRISGRSALIGHLLSETQQQVQYKVQTLNKKIAVQSLAIEQITGQINVVLGGLSAIMACLLIWLVVRLRSGK